MTHLAGPPDVILRRIAANALPAERLRFGIGSGTGPEPLRGGCRGQDRPATFCRRTSP